MDFIIFLADDPEKATVCNAFDHSKSSAVTAGGCDRIISLHDDGQPTDLSVGI